MAQAQARQRALEDDSDELVGLSDKSAIPSGEGGLLPVSAAHGAELRDDTRNASRDVFPSGE